MSGYKDYLSNEMQGDMETPMKPKRTRLSQFRHGGYHSSMDEFFTAGKKSYGIRNVDVSQLGKYGSPGRGGNPRFSMAEFFGKNFMSNGGEVTTYNNPGNLEKGQGYAGETGKTYANDRERPFVVFDSPEMGVRALAMDLQTKIKRHEGDVDKIIAQYAPDNENDTKKYQEFVKQKLKKDKVTDKDLKFLVQAIIEKENKPEVASYYLENPDVMTKGLAMSYFQLPSGTSFEQAVNEISAKEATLKKVLKNRKPFQYGGGADAGAGSGFGGGGGSSSSGGNTGGNKGNNKGDRRGVRSLRDSGMVQGSTGYGPAGAGGQALGPSGNQGGNQGNQQDTTEDTTTTLNSPSFSPTYDYNPPKKDSLLDDFVDTYRDLTTFNTPLGVLSIEPKGLTSVEATLSFKKGGLLDRSSKK
tara:strand:+ start:3522 stop:4760 length:1239 start_codon:yes stop_codon:yes gene_type:complete